MAEIVQIDPLEIDFWGRLKGSLDIGYSYLKADGVYNNRVDGFSYIEADAIIGTADDAATAPGAFRRARISAAAPHYLMGNLVTS